MSTKMEVMRNESAAEFAARVQVRYEAQIMEVLKKPLLDVTNEDLRLVASQDDDLLMGTYIEFDNITLELLEPVVMSPCRWRARAWYDGINPPQTPNADDLPTERIVFVLSPSIRGMWRAVMEARHKEGFRRRSEERKAARVAAEVAQ